MSASTTVSKKIMNAVNRVDKKFISSMRTVDKTKDSEKGVESAVKEMVSEGIKAITGMSYDLSHHKTDGVITFKHEQAMLSFDGSETMDEVSILVETKKDEDFSKSAVRAGVIAQSVFYLRQMYDQGDTLPAVVIIADVDQIFAVPTFLLNDYVTNTHVNSEGNPLVSDWSLAPSGVKNHAVDLINALDQDKNISPYVRVIDDEFETHEFLLSVEKMMSSHEIVKLPITAKILLKKFLTFNELAFGGVLNADKKSGTPTNQEQISIFVSSLKGDPLTFLSNTQKNVLHHGKKVFHVISDGYDTFWRQYDNSYGIEEMKEITEIADTLIEEVDRRFHGDFWTPKIWVDKAHEMIEDALGEDWKENYTVWDPACGSKNLTRDYYFNDLYCSTLHQEEIDISSDYNPEANTFQYDFLNDDVVNMHTDQGIFNVDILEMTDDQISQCYKLPVGLVNSLKAKKPMVFLANPPYGQATSGQGIKHKEGISNNTLIGSLMSGMGHAKNELYTQFIYRVQLLAKKFGYTDKDDLHFFFFNKGFLTSPNFKIFVDGLTEQFHYNNGFMLNAGEFNGTSSAWGIIFSHWSLQGEKNQKEFIFDVLESTKDDQIEKITSWIGFSDRSRKTINGFPKRKFINLDTTAPFTKNGLESPDQINTRGKVYDEWIGYLSQDASNIQGSDKYTGIYTLGLKRGQGTTIIKDNIVHSSMVFSICRSVQEDIAEHKLLWVRDKDIFTAPSDELAQDAEFTADCMVYSLFDRQSNQSSLRNYEYNGNKYRVINEFFPFSKDFIKSMASEHKNNAVYDDVTRMEKKKTERTMFTWLQDHDADLSDEARDLLRIVKNIYKESFSVRDEYNKTHPRYQVNSWDAGWMQINRMVFGNDRIDDSFLPLKEEFLSARKKLGQKIAQAAYDDGIIAGI